jgi:hypothetical protein
MAVFWVVAPCSQKFTNVSEVLAASIIRTIIALMMDADYTALQPIRQPSSPTSICMENDAS